MLRPCLTCHIPTTGTRCSACQVRHRAAYHGTYAQRRAALLASQPPCYWCGQPATTADHVIPNAVGGAHSPLLPACHHCNSSRQHNTEPK